MVSLPRSDEIFVKGYPAKTSEAFCDGHVAAFAFFGGVPRSILYDNTRLAVAKILGDGTRKRSTLFGALQSHYVFEDHYGRPVKGNDKGKVEVMVGYARRTFKVPVSVNLLRNRRMMFSSGVGPPKSKSRNRIHESRSRIINSILASLSLCWACRIRILNIDTGSNGGRPPLESSP